MTSIQSKLSSDLAAAIKRVQEFASDALDCFALWNEMELAYRRKQFPSAFAAYAPFLMNARLWMLSGLILSLHKLLEEGDTPSIRRMISLALRDGVIDRTERTVLSKKIDAVHPISKKVKHVRNEVVAHAKIADTTAVMATVNINGKDLWTLTEACVEVFNSVATKVGACGLNVVDQCRNRTSNVLQLLRKLDRRN